jgi:hypothetical protein
MCCDSFACIFCDGYAVCVVKVVLYLFLWFGSMFCDGCAVCVVMVVLVCVVMVVMYVL